MIEMLTGLPRWAQGLLGAGLLIVAAMLWLHFHDRRVVNAHEAKVQVKIEASASAAASDAGQAAGQTKTEVEKTNAQAREDADRSDDPLAAGLGRLRQERARRSGSR